MHTIIMLLHRSTNYPVVYEVLTNALWNNSDTSPEEEYSVIRTVVSQLRVKMERVGIARDTIICSYGVGYILKSHIDTPMVFLLPEDVVELFDLLTTHPDEKRANHLMKRLSEAKQEMS